MTDLKERQEILLNKLGWEINDSNRKKVMKLLKQHSEIYGDPNPMSYVVFNIKNLDRINIEKEKRKNKNGKY